ncbi:MAG: hypothetical protein CO013_10005 [Syntrophobacterales bacterium CG_4_8_14_3_um_filter_58_8]|nr:MAG: hypothetical protein CO013_10005 [Syntrophobacterales bacterium CG_4_8_14_3_um_filter_58_8]
MFSGKFLDHLKHCFKRCDLVFPGSIGHLKESGDFDTFRKQFYQKMKFIRRFLLLPKIMHSYPSRPSVAQSITILAPMTDQYRYKRGNKASTHLFVDRKSKEEMIESP